MNHQGLILWLTGLSGAGKTTIASSVAQELRSQSCRVELPHLSIKHLSPTISFAINQPSAE